MKHCFRLQLVQLQRRSQAGLGEEQPGNRTWQRLREEVSEGVDHEVSCKVDPECEMFKATGPGMFDTFLISERFPIQTRQ